MSVFFRSPSTTATTPVRIALSTLTAGFVDVAIPVPAASGGFDPAMVDIIRLEIEADANFGSTFQSPATIIYIDSITTANGVVSLPFTSMQAPADFDNSGARAISGSTQMWLAQYPPATQ
jgi:hypothetical protein